MITVWIKLLNIKVQIIIIKLKSLHDNIRYVHLLILVSNDYCIKYFFMIKFVFLCSVGKITVWYLRKNPPTECINGIEIIPSCSEMEKQIYTLVTDLAYIELDKNTEIFLEVYTCICYFTGLLTFNMTSKNCCVYFLHIISSWSKPTYKETAILRWKVNKYREIPC